MYSLAGGSDYAEISAAALQVFLTFDNNNRRQSFDVSILDDSVLEFDVENFTLELRFDPLICSSTASKRNTQPKCFHH